jgi:hypothetical protein
VSVRELQNVRGLHRLEPGEHGTRFGTRTIDQSTLYKLKLKSLHLVIRDVLLLSSVNHLRNIVELPFVRKVQSKLWSNANAEIN